MNPGELRERAEILTLKETDGIYRWEKEKAVWCRYQETGKKNLFSKVGVGAAGAEILLREMPVDLTRAMRVRGQFLFLTDIRREGTAPRFLKVQAAQVSPVTATVSRQRAGIGENGYPENRVETVAECPVCLTEKYLRSNDETAAVESTVRLVAVAPKVLVCIPGDRMEIDGAVYRVEVCHTLEPYKNESEIERVEDD